MVVDTVATIVIISNCYTENRNPLRVMTVRRGIFYASVGAAGLAPAEAGCRRPCGSVEAHFMLDFVLRFQFLVGAERDRVGVALLVVGDAAPVEPGEAVAEGAEVIVFAVVGEIGGEVAANRRVLRFVVVGVFSGLVSDNGGGLGRIQRVIVGGVAVKLAGFGNEAGGAHIRDKNLRALVDLLGISSGDFGECTGDFPFNCWHGVNLRFVVFGFGFP